MEEARRRILIPSGSASPICTRRRISPSPGATITSTACLVHGREYAISYAGGLDLG
jgi:hypothetical protein